MSDALRERLDAMSGRQRRFLLETLASHLVAAGQTDRLGRLFSDDEWMAARVEGGNGTYSGYLEDVGVAWADAARPDAAARRAVPDCVHYALIRTSVNTVSGSVPPALTARAVQAGVWSVEMALSRAAATSDAAQRVSLYAAILGTGRVPARIERQTLASAVDAVVAVAREHDRARALATIAPFLSGEALARALENALAMKDTPRVRALTALMPRLDDAGRADALERARTAAKPADREAQILLVPHLAEADRDPAVRALITAIERRGDSSSNVRDLVTLAAGLSGPLRDRVLASAAAITGRITDKDLAWALEAVLPVLDAARRDALVDATFERVLTLDDADREYDIPRPVGMMALAPFLTGDKLTRGAAIAREMLVHMPMLQGTRAEVLAHFAVRLEGDARENALAEAVRISPTGEAVLVDVLAALPQDRREPILRKALDLALRQSERAGNSGDPSPRLQATSRLAPLLPDNLVRDAIAGSTTIRDASALAAALLRLSEHLDADSRERAQSAAFDAAWAGRGEGSTHTDFTPLLARFDEPVLRRVLDVAPKLSTSGGFTSDRAQALIAITPRASAETVVELTAVAQSLDSAWDRTETLTALLPRLEGQARLQAMRAAFESATAMTGASHYRANAIRDMAPFLDGEYVEAALEYVLTQDDRSSSDYVSQAIVALAPRLTGPLALRALPMIMGRPQAVRRVAGLVGLSPNLPAPQDREALTQAVDIALEMGTADLDAHTAAIAVVPHVEPARQRRMVAEAVARVVDHVYNAQMRVDGLAALIPFVEADARPALFEEAFNWVVRIENVPRRSELLARVARQLTADRLGWAIDRVRAVEDVVTRASLLAALLPFAAPARAAVLTAEIRGLIVEATRAFGTSQRTDLLEFIDTPSLFAPPIVSAAEADTMARGLATLRTEWRWL